LKKWTTRKIEKLFRKNIYSTNLQNDEFKKLIPVAQREQRGRINARFWTQEQLPDLGKRYGFLKTPEECQVACVYTAKGGVLKTTLSFNIARAAAFNGVKTLVIGLDVQCSITDLLSKNLDQYDSIDDIQSPPGLYNVIKGESNINEVIQVSDLPTLHYIPENPELSLLEHEFGAKDHKVKNLKELIEPLREKYDFIIFDCSPSWSILIKNALFSSNHIISPLGCDVGSFRSVSQNIQRITGFKEENDLVWNSFTMIPTLKENSKISSQIEAQYKSEYGDFTSINSIRRTVVGQESSLKFESVFEDSPNSPLSTDYFEIIKEIWSKVGGVNG
jgi:chromosome partitioning protein